MPAHGGNRSPAAASLSAAPHHTMATTAVTGTLRADRRTKALAPRLRPGDVALIHHVDLDSTAARALVDARVAAVVNAVASVSGRYPNRGPAILLEAGIPLVDEVGEGFFVAALEHEGTQVSVQGDAVTVAGGPSAVGKPMTPEHLAEALEAGRSNLSRELDSFARNTLEYMAEEKALLLDPVDLPDIATPMAGKHVMVIVRGDGYKEDLQAIGDTYLRDVRPVLVGVDGGADALLDVGLKPHLIIGDMDSVSDAALECGAELIVHGYADRSRPVPGLPRVRRLGLRAHVLHAPGTSEDVAMLLADQKGASLIVAVGTHFSVVEFLDKGRGGMASTFLVRLRVGSKLVDAKGIGRLWAERTRPATRDLVLLVAAALFPIAAIAFYSPWMRTVVNTIRLTLRSMF